MTKFKIGDKVRVIGSEIDFKRKEIGLEFVISRNEGEYDGETSWTDFGPEGEKNCVWRWKESELELIEQEAKVTEFQAGDVVRLIKGLNYFGEVVTPPTKENLILGWIVPELSKPGKFDAWGVESGWGWVRSDDIELVSRPVYGEAIGGIPLYDPRKEATEIADLKVSNTRLADSNEAKRRRLKKIKKKLKKLLKEIEDVIVD